jgi:hypothetical protein
MRVFRSFAIFICITLLATMVSHAQELSADEIIAKHVASVGKKEVLDQVKTLFALGLSSFESQSPQIKGGGKSMVVSDHGDLMWAISLNSRDYPYEKIGYFKDKVSLPYISAGQRSLLGTFIIEHPRLLTEGLFGGVMSLRWPLFEMKGKSRIKSLGIKKVDGRKLYALSYQPDGGGADEFTIKLFFDSETFAHVRSEYHREFSPANPQFGQANQLSNSEITLTENFGDFKTVDGITLPYTYAVEFSSNSNTSSYKTTWGIKVSQYYINQQLAADFFTFDPK